MRTVPPNQRFLVFWALLVLLTLASFKSAWLSREVDVALLQPAMVILFASFKSRIIALHFMELRTAPWKLRCAIELWLLLLCTTMLVMLTYF